MSLLLRHSVVICTQYRIIELEELLNSIVLFSSGIDLSIYVVENSGSDINFEKVTIALRKYEKTLDISLLKSEPGLPRSRNIALSQISTDLIHFLDDDVLLTSDYFQSAESHFLADSKLVGLAPFIESPPQSGSIAKIIIKVRSKLIKSLKLEGKISKSGRSYWLVQNKDNIEVDWLPGCTMSYRLGSIKGQKFSESLEKGPLQGYALGEDVDFSSSVKLNGTLMAIAGVSVLHNLAPNNRTNWSVMDEGIGRWFGYLERTKPNLVNRKYIIALLVLDAVKIQTIKLILNFKGNRTNRDSLLRLKAFLSESSNPTMIDEV